MIFAIILFMFIKLINIYIPNISIPRDRILKKKKDTISFIMVLFSRDFELKTYNLLVINAKATDKNQAQKLFTYTFIPVLSNR